jgi:hypothetical protein
MTARLRRAVAALMLTALTGAGLGSLMVGGIGVRTDRSQLTCATFERSVAVRTESRIVALKALASDADTACDAANDASACSPGSMAIAWPRPEPLLSILSTYRI